MERTFQVENKAKPFLCKNTMALLRNSFDCIAITFTTLCEQSTCLKFDKKIIWAHVFEIWEKSSWFSLIQNHSHFLRSHDFHHRDNLNGTLAKKDRVILSSFHKVQSFDMNTKPVHSSKSCWWLIQTFFILTLAPKEVWGFSKRSQRIFWNFPTLPGRKYSFSSSFLIWWSQLRSSRCW